MRKGSHQPISKPWILIFFSQFVVCLLLKKATDVLFRKSNNYVDFFCLFRLSIKNFQVDQVKTNNKFCEKKNPGFIDSELVAGIPRARYRLWKRCCITNVQRHLWNYFPNKSSSLLGPYELTFAIKKALSKTDDVYYLYSSN